jgi:hypothetical protein
MDTAPFVTARWWVTFIQGGAEKRENLKLMLAAL